LVDGGVGGGRRKNQSKPWAVWDWAVVMVQQNLFYIEPETSTESSGHGLHTSQITGDLGEIEFDRFCTKNNIAYYKASSAAGKIDRIILTKESKTIKIHIKGSVRHYNKATRWYYYNFLTYKSSTPADYYYCTGFSEKNHEKQFSLWIPYEIGKEKTFTVPENTLYKFIEFENVPKEIINSENILPFICP
jgi:hypothetical protein